MIKRKEVMIDGGLPSSRKASGHPMAIFHLVKVLQKILSKFHIMKPNANRPQPVQNNVVILQRSWCSILPLFVRNRYSVRAAMRRTRNANTTW
jgi:hypothetical protein